MQSESRDGRLLAVACCVGGFWLGSMLYPSANGTALASQPNSTQAVSTVAEQQKMLAIVRTAVDLLQPDDEEYALHLLYLPFIRD